MNAKINLDKICQEVNEVGAKLVELQKNSLTRDPSFKADGSPVTKADFYSHERLRDLLRREGGGFPILSEEDDSLAGVSGSRDYWLVDPLDGTKEFVKGRADFTVNVALILEGKPVIGVIGAPAHDQIYWAQEGGGAWRSTAQGPPTQIRAAKEPLPGAQVRIVESSSHKTGLLFGNLYQKFKVIERLELGSSLKLCLLAEGRVDLYLREAPCWQWDIAAGDAIFREAQETPNPRKILSVYTPENLRVAPFIGGLS